MKSKQTLTLLAAAVIGALSANAALFVDTETGGLGDDAPTVGVSSGSYIEGAYSIEFTVNTPVLVDGLGVFDQGADGFGGYAGTWNVGIWQNTGGTAGSLVTPLSAIDGSNTLVDGIWRFESFTGVQLNPGITYSITIQDSTGFGASLYNANGDINAPSDSTIQATNLDAVYGSEFNVIRSRYRGTGGLPFAPGDVFAGVGTSREGALAASTIRMITASYTVVPEPETYALIAGAGLVGFGLWRRRASKA